MKRQYLISQQGVCGKQVITTIFIAEGESIFDFSKAKRIQQPTYQSIQINPKEHVMEEDKLLRLNHSCNPNVFIDTQAQRAYALRDIHAYDELTFFYPSTEWLMAQAFACHCGSTNCIGIVAGAASLPKEQLHQHKINQHILNMLK